MSKDGSELSYLLLNPAAMLVAVTELSGGQFDGRPIVMVRSPVDAMPLAMSPECARTLARRLEGAATHAEQLRAEIMGESND